MRRRDKCPASPTAPRFSFLITQSPILRCYYVQRFLCSLSCDDNFYRKTRLPYCTLRTTNLSRCEFQTTSTNNICCARILTRQNEVPFACTRKNATALGPPFHNNSPPNNHTIAGRAPSVESPCSSNNRRESPLRRVALLLKQSPGEPPPSSRPAPQTISGRAPSRPSHHRIAGREAYSTRSQDRRERSRSHDRRKSPLPRRVARTLNVGDRRRSPTLRGSLGGRGFFCANVASRGPLSPLARWSCSHIALALGTMARHDQT